MQPPSHPKLLLNLNPSHASRATLLLTLPSIGVHTGRKRARAKLSRHTPAGTADVITARETPSEASVRRHGGRKRPGSRAIQASSGRREG
jgi:hypothetical protein